MVNFDFPKVSKINIKFELLRVSKMTNLKIYIYFWSQRSQKHQIWTPDKGQILFLFGENLKNFINFLINYVLLRNVKCKVMLTEAYLELRRTSRMELFPLQLNHVLKAYLIQSNCLQVPFFTQLTLPLKNLQL